jgi:hypothetical protein
LLRIKTPFCQQVLGKVPTKRPTVRQSGNLAHQKRLCMEAFIGFLTTVNISVYVVISAHHWLVWLLHILQLAPKQ